MDRLARRLEQLLSGASDIPWKELAAELRYRGFVVKQSKGKATHWAVYYPGLPETPIQTVVVDKGALRKPKYLSMIGRLVRTVLDALEEDSGAQPRY